LSEKQDRILRKLREIVGDQFASDEEHVLYPYSFDLTWATPRMPDYVVMPKTVEDVQRIVRLANLERIPIVPYCSGTNIGGLTIPEQGGIIVDLKRMNRIIEINTDVGYAVFEPGVSHAKLSAALKEKGYDFGWPVGTPSASPLALAVNHGIGHFSSRFGINSEFITGMEVVLPTGEIAKVGSCAFSDSWHSLFPLPMLSGLFVGWLGTTGIVTKLGVWVVEAPPYRDVVTVKADTIEDMTRYMIRFRKTYAADELTAVSWWLAQVPIPYPYQEKSKDAPEWFSFAVLRAWSEKELEAKRDLWKTAVKEEQKKGSSLLEFEYPPEAKRARTELPSRIIGSTKNYCGAGVAGIAWPGTFTPAVNWPKLYNEWKKIYVAHNLSPAVRVTDFKGSHYGMLRAMTPFDKKTPEAIENAKDAMLKAVEAGIRYGLIPYKPPVDYQSILNSKADPGYIQLVTKVKDMLDPNNIMNPGKLGVR